MRNYIAAAFAAIALSVTAAPVMAEPQSSAIAASCIPSLGLETGTPEACRVIVVKDDGMIGVGFALESSGSIVFFGTPEAGGVKVAAIGFPEEEGSTPVVATGRCATQGQVIACSASVTGEAGTATIAVRADASAN